MLLRDRHFPLSHFLVISMNLLFASMLISLTVALHSLASGDAKLLLGLTRYTMVLSLLIAVISMAFGVMYEPHSKQERWGDFSQWRPSVKIACFASVNWFVTLVAITGVK